MAASGNTVHPENFVLLDGFRGLGAVLILVGHTMPLWGPFWAPSGAVMVDAFFLLSGFVVAYAYEPKLAAGMTASQFMTHRIVRLYPLYLLGTLLGAAVFFTATLGDPNGGPRSSTLALQLVPQLFMLPAPGALGNSILYPLNLPAWTLFFELAVNLVYVLVFRWLTTRMLALVVGLCAVALAIAVFAFGDIGLGSDWRTFWGGFARAGFGFFAGVLAYRLAGSPTTAKRPQSRWALALLVALPPVCLIPATPELRPFLDMLLVVGLGIPLLLAGQSCAPSARFSAPLLLGGRISYAVYILHQPFWEIAKRVNWRTSVIEDIAPAGGIALLTMVVFLAWLAEKYYDRPVRRWIVRQLKRRAAARMTASTAEAAVS